jgi:hypothetical protein
MDTENRHGIEIAAQLKRLDVDTRTLPAFDYDTMFARRAQRDASARRRSRAASATATMLVVALVGASVWRMEPRTDVAAAPPADTTVVAAPDVTDIKPRIVRADTYLAVAALEDHIASVDDALSVARAYSPRGGEVARLERMRAELMDSYAQVRYAQLVSANF